MKSNPEISVLMSVYNGKKYLQKSIESILNQTFSNFEFIIINDASIDNSLEIIKSFSDSRIVILNNSENLGLTKSLNIGLKQASGKYIARLDADDLSFENRLEKQLSFIKKNNLSLIGSSAILIDELGNEIGKKIKPENPTEIKFHLLLKNPFLHSSLFFKKEDIEKIGYYDEKFIFAQDYDLVSRLSHSGFNLGNISEPLIKYRIQKNSITENKDYRKEQLKNALKTSLANCLLYIHLNKKNISSLIKGINGKKTGFFETISNLINFSLLKSSFLKKEKISEKDYRLIKKIYLSEQKTILASFLKNHFSL